MHESHEHSTTITMHMQLRWRGPWQSWAVYHSIGCRGRRSHRLGEPRGSNKVTNNKASASRVKCRAYDRRKKRMQTSEETRTQPSAHERAARPPREERVFAPHARHVHGNSYVWCAAPSPCARVPAPVPVRYRSRYRDRFRSGNYGLSNGNPHCDVSAFANLLPDG